MNGMLSRRQFLALSGASLGVFTASAWSQSDGTLRLAFIPQENPEKILGDIATITRWMSSELGVVVKGFVTIDHPY